MGRVAGLATDTGNARRSEKGKEDKQANDGRRGKMSHQTSMALKQLEKDGLKVPGKTWTWEQQPLTSWRAGDGCMSMDRADDW